MKNEASYDWESAGLFWLLFLLGAALVVFGHHDPKQVLKMRILGFFLLLLIVGLRWLFGFGKFVRK